MPATTVSVRAVVAGVVLLLATGAGVGTASAAAQLTAIVAPGPLSKAHASLEGIGKCVQCHEPGRLPSVSRCLKCHKPIADRIALKKGVHREVAGDCVRCHVEHKGADVDLRRIDVQTFDHSAETGFALEGRHAALERTCTACHKARSFIVAKPACGSCHADVHKTTLGSNCTRCHSPATPFKETRTQFDHTRAQFQLTGAHRSVACEKCHVAGVFSGLKSNTCSACHQEPHRQKFGPTCTSCHVTDHWSTRTVEHSKTGFTLVGAHTEVPCAKCHTAGITKPLRADRCSACHVNVHRDSVKDDCRACHTENGFKNARFDHARTAFALAGRHEGLACRKCHTTITPNEVPLARKVIDFGGMKTECAACHADQHKGEYGRTCEACHRPTMAFKMSGFAHPRAPEFYGGSHAAVPCVRCHVRSTALQPVRSAAALRADAAPPSMACRTCHADVHLGQVGPACERCHSIDAPKFAPARFSHETGAFPLTGKHQALECAKCHPSETRAFPAGTGTAMRLSQMPTECQVCHKDPHLGQVDRACNSCHATATFKLAAYTHRTQSELFTGFHRTLTCRSCHKEETGQFPAGRGTAVRLKVGSACRTCHEQF